MNRGINKPIFLFPEKSDSDSEVQQKLREMNESGITLTTNRENCQNVQNNEIFSDIS